MTDLICRKSMMRCQTPGMCSPHGGCQPSALIETNVRYSASSGAGVTDTTELKRLAGALSRAIEQAEHKPGQWAETAQSMGGICLPGEPFQIGKPWAKEEPWANFSYKRDSWLAVAAVNALPQLMALISENDDYQAGQDRYEDLCEDQRNEIRELKAEVEALRKHAPSAEIIWCACGDGYPANSYGAGFMDANNGVCENCDAANGGVEPDLDTLRKDAERYRWLREGMGKAIVVAPAGTELVECEVLLDEEVDVFVDAAMSKEAGHD